MRRPHLFELAPKKPREQRHHLLTHQTHRRCKPTTVAIATAVVAAVVGVGVGGYSELGEALEHEVLHGGGEEQDLLLDAN